MVATRAHHGGNDLLLNAKEFTLLLVFVQHEDAVLTKEALYEAVWNAPANSDTCVLCSHTSRLHRKLEGSPFTTGVTRGECYRFEMS